MREMEATLPSAKHAVRDLLHSTQAGGPETAKLWFGQQITVPSEKRTASGYQKYSFQSILSKNSGIIYIIQKARKQLLQPVASCSVTAQHGRKPSPTHSILTLQKFTNSDQNPSLFSVPQAEKPQLSRRSLLQGPVHM